jgi:hypothetical protein
MFFFVLVRFGFFMLNHHVSVGVTKESCKSDLVFWISGSVCMVLFGEYSLVSLVFVAQFQSYTC